MDNICPTHPTPQIPIRPTHGNYHKKNHVLKQDISPLQENDTCLHLLSCCTNQHENNLYTNKRNKVVHTLAATLMAPPTTRCFTLINASKTNDHTLENLVLSWLLPCTCYLPRCKFPAKLRLDILSILGTIPTSKPPFTPRPDMKAQFLNSHIVMTDSPKQPSQES